MMKFPQRSHSLPGTARREYALLSAAFMSPVVSRPRIRFALEYEITNAPKSIASRISVTSCIATMRCPSCTMNQRTEVCATVKRTSRFELGSGRTGTSVERSWDGSSSSMLYLGTTQPAILKITVCTRRMGPLSGRGESSSTYDTALGGSKPHRMSKPIQ